MPLPQNASSLKLAPIRQHPLSRTLLAALAMLASPIVAGADTWRLLDASFATRDVPLASVDDRTVKGSDGTSVALDDIVELRAVATSTTASPAPQATSRRRGDGSRNAARTAIASKYLLVLADGQRIAGTPEGIDGESLKWKGVASGEWTVDLKQVRQIAPPAAIDAATSTDPATEDVVRLKNGDAVRGVLSAADAKTLSVQATGGDATTVDWANVASLQLAGDAPRPPALDGGPLVRVTLTDGSVLLGTAATTADGKAWAFTDRAGARRDLAAGSVSLVERLGGKVVWLSTVAPAEVVDQPYFPSARPRVAILDRAARHQPATVAGQPVERSLSVRSHSLVRYDVPGGFRQFRFRYALPDDCRAGNVTLRVRVGDKQVFEKADVVAGKLSEVVTLDASGAKSVTLEADYGKNYDVQDQLEWVDAALVR